MKNTIQRFIAFLLVVCLLTETAGASFLPVQGIPSVRSGDSQRILLFNQQAFAARLATFSRPREWVGKLSARFTHLISRRTGKDQPPVIYWSVLTRRAREQAKEFSLFGGIIGTFLPLMGVVIGTEHITLNQLITLLGSLLGGVVFLRPLAIRVAARVHTWGSLIEARYSAFRYKATIISNDGNLILVRQSDNEPIVDKQIARAGPVTSGVFAAALFTVTVLAFLTQPLLTPWVTPAYPLNGGLAYSMLLFNFVGSLIGVSVRFFFITPPAPPKPSTSFQSARTKVLEEISRLSPMERDRLRTEGRAWMEETYYTYLEDGFDQEIVNVLGVSEDIIYIAFRLAVQDNQRRPKLTKDDSPYLKFLEEFKIWHHKQRVKIEVTQMTDTGDAYALTIRTHPRQPGNMEKITEIISLTHRVKIANGTRKSGSTTEFLIEKTTREGTPLNIQALVDDIQDLDIERGESRPQVKDIRRKALHLFLSNDTGSFHALLKALTPLNIVIESFTFDQWPGDPLEWCDLIIRIPNNKTDKELDNTLKGLQLNGKRLLDEPRLREVSDVAISEATAQAALRIVERKLIALGESVEETILPGARNAETAGSVDEAFLHTLQKAMDIAFDYHGNIDPDHPKRPRLAAFQRRLSNGQPTITHPLLVLHTSIAHYGTRHPITLFAEINHDVPEDGPENVWKLIEGKFWAFMDRPIELLREVEELKKNHSLKPWKRDGKNWGMAETLDKMVQELTAVDVTEDPSLTPQERTELKVWRIGSIRFECLRLAGEEIQARFKRDFPAYPHKLLQSIGAVTKKPGYLKTLKEKGFVEFTTMKLVDREVNLRSIFDVGMGFAKKQLANTLQEFLPLIMQNTTKSEGFVSGRRHFLSVLIQQCSKLTETEGDAGWESIYDLIKATSELPSDLPKAISDFNRWLDRNPDLIPTSVSPDTLKAFQDRLDTLARQLAGSQLPRHTKDTTHVRLTGDGSFDPNIVFDYLNSKFTKEMNKQVHETDRAILKRILSTEPAELAELLREFPDKVYINFTERDNPSEGRTVYLDLVSPIQISGHRISVIALKSVRPRLGPDGTVLTYPAGTTGHAPFNIEADSDGSLTKKLNPPTPYGTMAPEAAQQEQRIIRTVSKLGLESDRSLGSGTLTNRKHEGHPTAFTMTGLQTTDVRLSISPNGADGRGAIYAVDRKTGERTRLKDVEARRILMSLGKALRRLHDSGIYQRDVYSANIGVQKLTPGESHTVVLRDYETARERNTLEGAFTQRRDAALRFLDLWRMAYDLLTTQQNDLAGDLIRGYFEDSGTESADVEAAIKQIQNKRWIIIWTFFWDPKNNNPLFIDSQDPTLGTLWKILLGVSFKTPSGDGATSLRSMVFIPIAKINMALVAALFWPIVKIILISGLAYITLHFLHRRFLFLRHRYPPFILRSA